MENCTLIYQKQIYLSVRLRNNFIDNFKNKYELEESNKKS
jgi:hypothetical protein